METPYITCRAPAGCHRRAVIYALYGCLNQHIIEMAVCERHYNYNSIYVPKCPLDGLPIQHNEYLRLEKVTYKYQNLYIQRSWSRGGTPTED